MVSLALSPAEPTEPVIAVVPAAPAASFSTALAATASAISFDAPRLSMLVVTARPNVILAAAPVIPPDAKVGSMEPRPLANFSAQTSISPAPSPNVSPPRSFSEMMLRFSASFASSLMLSTSAAEVSCALLPTPATTSRTGDRRLAIRALA